MARGRPKKRDKDGNIIYDIPTMVKKINKYTDECITGEKLNIPIAKECYLKNGWDCDYVNQLARENDELSLSIKRMLGYKEVYLEKLATVGAIDKTMAIFSLKQLGWRDEVKSDINLTAKRDTEILDSVLNQMKKADE
jgi:hypothetical protein